MVVHHQITISDVHYTLSCLQVRIFIIFLCTYNFLKQVTLIFISIIDFFFWQQAMQMIQEPSLNQTGKTENALSF